MNTVSSHAGHTDRSEAAVASVASYFQASRESAASSLPDFSSLWSTVFKLPKATPAQPASSHVKPASSESGKDSHKVEDDKNQHDKKKSRNHGQAEAAAAAQPVAVDTTQAVKSIVKTKPGDSKKADDSSKTVSTAADGKSAKASSGDSQATMVAVSAGQADAAKSAKSAGSDGSGASQSPSTAGAADGAVSSKDAKQESQAKDAKTPAASKKAADGPATQKPAPGPVSNAPGNGNAKQPAGDGTGAGATPAKHALSQGQPAHHGDHSENIAAGGAKTSANSSSTDTPKTKEHFLNIDVKQVAGQSVPIGTARALRSSNMAQVNQFSGKVETESTSTAVTPSANVSGRDAGIAVGKTTGANAGSAKGGDAGGSTDAGMLPFAGGQPSAASGAVRKAPNANQPLFNMPQGNDIDESSAMPAISSAINRMIASNQNQLSLQIHFQDGGSLSMKLAMQQGQIHSTFHTDVQGLESAIRAHWHELSNSLQNQGVQLSDPKFSSQTASGGFSHQGQGSQGQSRYTSADSGSGSAFASAGGHSSSASSAVDVGSVVTAPINQDTGSGAGELRVWA